MSNIKFSIPGEPKAKARPRVTVNGTFTPKETLEYENWIKACFFMNYPTGKKIEGQLLAEIKTYFTIPKAANKKKRAAMIEGSMRPTKKPDLDNIAKAVLDSLNKIAFNDDSQIVKLSIEKYYSENPKIEVMIKSI